MSSNSKVPTGSSYIRPKSNLLNQYSQINIMRRGEGNSIISENILEENNKTAEDLISKANLKQQIVTHHNVSS